MKYLKTASLATSLLLFTSAPIVSSSELPSQNKPQQPALINKIINAEKNKAKRDAIVKITEQIDQTYGYLYENIEKGGKLTVFFDPAHGKLSDGRWQGGAATGRLSCTGLPEEWYSIKFSRKMYELLEKNRHIEVRSTDDFMDVLRGKSDSYRDIPFPVTVDLANRAGAFIIIAQHLNNISVVHKADGLVNLPGIHITRNAHGWKILRYVKDTYQGFLTLYNKLDASGFSMKYALKLKNMLEKRGLKANSWDHGAVGDSRFCYFVDFPVSIIYESGFISNPDEEKKLSDPEHIGTMVEAQYLALLETVEEIFGVDISGSRVRKTGEPSADRLELLKLARLAVYYIKSGDVGGGIRVIHEMEKKYSGSKYREHTRYFSSVRSSLARYNSYHRKGLIYKKKKNYRKARYCFRLARRSLQRGPIFSTLHGGISRELPGRTRKRTSADRSSRAIASFNPIVPRAPINRSVLFPLEPGQSLDSAVRLALEADGNTHERLVNSFKNARTFYKKRERYYSKKHKKRMTRWVTRSKHVSFTPGIYVVQLNKKLNVVGVRRVNSVVLNHDRYQNQQYLKNSHFANDTRERSL